MISPIEQGVLPPTSHHIQDRQHIHRPERSGRYRTGYLDCRASRRITRARVASICTTASGRTVLDSTNARTCPWVNRRRRARWTCSMRSARHWPASQRANTRSNVAASSRVYNIKSCDRSTPCSTATRPGRRLARPCPHGAHKTERLDSHRWDRGVCAVQMGGPGAPECENNHSGRR